MSLKILLESFGDRLGILEMAGPPTGQTAAKIQTRTVTLAELATEIRSEEVQTLADLPAELTVSFNKIFDSAGVKPAQHGWNVDRLKQILSSDQFKNVDRSTIQKEVLGILSSAGVGVEDLVKDAVGRDQALDSFEAFVRKKMEDRLAAQERRIAELESKVAEFQSQISALRENARVDTEGWQEWRKQKKAVEQELAWIVGYLVDRSVITTGE